MSVQQFCLRWNNHQPNFISVFTALLNTGSLVDVTLAAEGKYLQAHKVVLSACSVYFQTLFTSNPSRHPIVILKDVKYSDLRIMIDFMYYGEVNVSQDQLPEILETAKMLKIKGLTEMPDSTSLTKSQSTSSADVPMPGDSSWESQRHSISPCNLSPSVKRKRLRKTSTGSGSTSIERNTEEKSFENPASMTSLNLVKSDSITLSSLPQVRRKDSFHEYKEPGENGGMETTIHQSTDQSNNCLMRTVDQPIDDQTATNLSQQGSKSKGSNSRRAKLLIRQPRVKKDSESQATPTEEEPSTSRSTPPMYTRQMSEPLPVHITHVPPELLMIRKQVSHPLQSNTIKQVSRTVTPLVVSNVMLSVSEIKSETRSRPEHETITCESDLPPTSTSDPPLDFRENTSEIYDSLRSSHCPAIRSGPALSCNFCWNTVDDHGRILRRKTKYHCPECQANLCIVPCFHEYHERNPLT